MMSIVDNKKRGIIILVIFVLVASVGLFLVLKSINDSQVRKVKLDNGDEIILNQGGISAETIATQPFDENYVITDKREFMKAFPKHATTNGKICLQGKMKIRNYFQFARNKYGKTTGDYDEIYQWETDIYRDAQAKIFPMQRNSGYRYGLADRGYMELSLYKDHPQRIKLEDTFKSTDYIKCFVNGKKVVLNEYTAEGINSERKFYTAQFQDIDGNGTGAYFTADNVNSDYFITILEILAGKDYPIPAKIGGNQDGKADSEAAFVKAREEITFKNAAEKMVYDKKRTEIEKHGKASFSIIADYYRQPKMQEDKMYNVFCEFYMKGVRAEDWYMLLDKNRGKYEEIGESLIVPV